MRCAAVLGAAMLIGCGDDKQSLVDAPAIDAPMHDARIDAPTDAPTDAAEPDAAPPDAAAARTKVDILFMIDNSSSMLAMQSQLSTQFPDFLAPLAIAGASRPLDLHIGVVTSDYGAGATGAPSCQASPGGQLGRLQALGMQAMVGCQAPVGAPYVEYRFDPAGDTSNLPAGQSLAQTFACMSAVGSTGCGFEHPLESVRAALSGSVAQNSGFLRSDAVLAVVFFTNEDDCSAPPTTQLFDRNRVAQFGYLDSYRCTRYGIVCGNPAQLPPYADSGGVLTGCTSAPNPGGAGPGELYDLSRYTSFFGAIKADPHDMILAAIDAPATPVQVILSNPGTPGGQPYQICSPLDETSNPACVPVLQHSCMNGSQPTFFGDPAVRLNAVVTSSPAGAAYPICDADYTAALQDIAAKILARL